MIHRTKKNSALDLFMMYVFSQKGANVNTIGYGSGEPKTPRKIAHERGFHDVTTILREAGETAHLKRRG